MSTSAVAASAAVPIPVFIGFDPRERAAINVLIDSLVQQSSLTLAITPIVTPQLQSLGVLPRRHRRALGAAAGAVRGDVRAA